MNRYALVSDGMVQNVVVAEALADAEEIAGDLEVVALAFGEVCGPGWAHDGEEWVAPPDPEPLPDPEPSLQDQMDALILDNLTTTAALQQQIDDLILALLG